MDRRLNQSYDKSDYMNKIKFLLALCLGFSLQTFAQQTTARAEIKTPEASCDMCKNRIETYLGRLDGVLKVKVDTKKRTTTVDWLTARTNIEEVKTAIANCGFDADDVEAEETAYKRLPRECKKPGAIIAADTLKHN